jgi:hypothetical protein
MSIYSVVMSTLNPLAIPTFPIIKRGDYETYITFFQYDEAVALAADDEEKQTGYYIQVDFWTKDALKYTALSEKVKKTLVAAGFTKKGVVDLYEDDTQIYHKGLRFYYVLKQ